MYFVGEFYFEGEIIPRDRFKAYKWIKRSIIDADLHSNFEVLKQLKVKLKEIEKELTPEQIAAVNKELGITN